MRTMTVMTASMMVVATLLTACGGGGGSSPPPVSLPAPTPSPAPAPAPTPTPAPVSVERDIAPAATSAQITTNLSAHTAINPSPGVTARGRLFVMLPGTGAVARNYREILRTGARQGFHTIGLTYPNDTAVGDLCAGAANADCAELARREIITGSDLSPLVTVNAANAIAGRLTALLTYLNTNFPNEGWGQFLVGGAPDWSRIGMAGHSQGSGHAAMMGKLFVLDRVAMFSGPGDFFGANIAPWLTLPNMTPATRIYGFTHRSDELVPVALVQAAWRAIGLEALGAAADVDALAPPYGGSHILLSNAPARPGAPSATPLHGGTVADAITPLNASGTPLYEPVWIVMAFQ